MKLTHALLPLGAVALTVAACGKSPSASSVSDDTTIEFDTRVDSIGYEIINTMTGDTTFAAAKYSAVWPRKIGQQDFAALRDSLMYYTFGTTSASSFEAAADEYMSAGQYAGSDSKVTEINYDTAFSAASSSIRSVSSEVTLLTPSVLVIQVSDYTYDYGEAHGSQSRSVINFSILDHKILNAGNMFLPESRDALLELINAKAKEAYPEEGALFSDPITEIGQPQITDTDVVFIYQQYTVAPYSTGIVEIPVSQYDLTRYLTPAASAILAADD